MLNKNKLATLLAEFVGVFAISLGIFSTLSLSIFPFFYAIIAGLTIAALGSVFGAHAKALFNPAIAIGLWVQRKLDAAETLFILGAHILGAIAAWQWAGYMLGQDTPRLAEWGVNWQLMLAEGVGALLIGHAVAAAMATRLDVSAQARLVGAVTTVGMLVASLGGKMTGILNPAVAVGVNSLSWAYVVGPIIGVAVGMMLHTLLFTERAASAAVVAKTKATATTAKKTTKTAKSKAKKATTKKTTTRKK